MITISSTTSYTARAATPGAGLTLSGVGTAVGGVTLQDGDRVLVTDSTPGLYVARAGAWDQVQMAYGPVLVAVREGSGVGLYSAEVPRALTYSVGGMAQIA